MVASSSYFSSFSYMMHGHTYIKSEFASLFDYYKTKNNSVSSGEKSNTCYLMRRIPVAVICHPCFWSFSRFVFIHQYLTYESPHTPYSKILVTLFKSIEQHHCNRSRTWKKLMTVLTSPYGALFPTTNSNVAFFPNVLSCIKVYVYQTWCRDISRHYRSDSPNFLKMNDSFNQFCVTHSSLSYITYVTF